MNLRATKPVNCPATFALIAATLLTLGVLFLLPGCGASSSSSNDAGSSDHQGTSFTLGNLSVVLYDQEIVHNTAGNDCLALYLSVTNRGTSEESVMGSYNVSRNQGAGTHLKVAVAYDTNGNALHTGNKHIKPGATEDIALCFVLENTKPVTITFGNKERGITETTLTIPLPEASE